MVMRWETGGALRRSTGSSGKRRQLYKEYTQRMPMIGLQQQSALSSSANVPNLRACGTADHGAQSPGPFRCTWSAIQPKPEPPLGDPCPNNGTDITAEGGGEAFWGRRASALLVPQTDRGRWRATCSGGRNGRQRNETKGRASGLGLAHPIRSNTSPTLYSGDGEPPPRADPRAHPDTERGAECHPIDGGGGGG
eukprot:CAMPEP_0174287596 /NCGR_PEP_ID=MMETSP0809-20121228/16505_1 /TAXON_ID=73025 ORGANISM="Eutreptiella gymnastica-like, Strain CCMP1594" /NCGR_SAMPLE_ID=MMETSP0809 /ASSEMBLY_ACC=CAM_ASM_000658 /LENGTH=193 /DNA_ID=CAMNT_0015384223 /DNA_START=156 /DNA_END=736 /DNA_ORIENTATION=-